MFNHDPIASVSLKGRFGGCAPMGSSAKPWSGLVYHIKSFSFLCDEQISFIMNLAVEVNKMSMFY